MYSWNSRNVNDPLSFACKTKEGTTYEYVDINVRARNPAVITRLVVDDKILPFHASSFSLYRFACFLGKVDEQTERQSAMKFPGVAVIFGAGSGNQNWISNAHINTGKYAGIGRATAKLYAKELCSRILFADININALKGTKEDIQKINSSTDVLIQQCGTLFSLDYIKCLKRWLTDVDVTSEISISDFISKTAATLGRIDYACNVASILMPGSSPEFSAAEFDKQFSVNTRGMWLCQKYEIQQMLKQEPLHVPESIFSARGAIANVSSMAALRAYDNLPSYCATKSAVLGFIKADGLRYAKNLIRINAVCLGVIRTPLLGKIADDDTTNVADMTSEMAVKRQGLPEEIAECLLWINSGRASFVTATHLAANGGMILCNAVGKYNKRSILK